MWQINCISSIALGNGTRPRGFVFGIIESEEHVAAAIEAAQMGDCEVVCELVAAEEGVDRVEILSALRTYAGGGPIQIVDPSRPEKDAKPSDDPRSLSIEDLELTPGVVRSLHDAGITTVGELIAFGDANEGFTSVEGIGASGEAKIIAALKKL